MEKLIITAAITGSRITREAAPYIPITPEEVVQSAIKCRQAGASIVHLHVRDPETGLGTQDLEIFKQVVEPLREKTDLVLCLTTSGIPGRNIPIYYSKGVLARSNAEFVERIVRIAREYGREIATPEEARKILKLQ